MAKRSLCRISKLYPVGEMGAQVKPGSSTRGPRYLLRDTGQNQIDAIAFGSLAPRGIVEISAEGNR